MIQGVGFLDLEIRFVSHQLWSLRSPTSRENLAHLRMENMVKPGKSMCENLISANLKKITSIQVTSEKFAYFKKGALSQSFWKAQLGIQGGGG
jgi:hypothetical protein